MASSAFLITVNVACADKGRSGRGLAGAGPSDPVTVAGFASIISGSADTMSMGMPPTGCAKIGAMTAGTGAARPTVNRGIAPAVSANDSSTGSKVMTICTISFMRALIRLDCGLTVNHVTGMTTGTRCNGCNGG